MNTLLKIFAVYICLIPLALSAQVSDGITEINAPEIDAEKPSSFGLQTAIFENTMIVANSKNRVYLFQKSNDIWKKIKILEPNNDNNEGFGACLAVDENTIAIGAPFAQTDANGKPTASQAGAVYIYTKSNGQWKQSQKIVAKDFATRNQFGNSLDLHNGTLVIGAQWKDEVKDDGQKIMMAGAVYVYKKQSGKWTENQILNCPVSKNFGINFGRKVKIHENTIVCAGLSEELYVFELKEARFEYLVALKASSKIGDYTIGIENFDLNSNAIICGAAHDNSDQGAAFVFTKNQDGNYLQTKKLIISEGQTKDNFGSQIAIQGDDLLITSYAGGNTESSHCSCGAVYLFKLINQEWVLQEKIMACENGKFNNIGSSTSIHNGKIVLGAPGKAIGIEEKLIKGVGTVFTLER